MLAKERLIPRLPIFQIIFFCYFWGPAVTESLKASEEKFKQLFNNINDAVFLHKMDGNYIPTNFIEVNDTACKILGYTREELLSK